MQYAAVGRSIWVNNIGNCRVIAHYKKGNELMQVVQFKDTSGKTETSEGPVK